MSDEIILTLPEQPAFHDVAHLVVGGLGVRLNLTFENLEDLQTALDHKDRRHYDIIHERGASHASRWTDGSRHDPTFADQRPHPAPSTGSEALKHRMGSPGRPESPSTRRLSPPEA